MARNDTTKGLNTATKSKPGKTPPANPCSNCGGSLEPVANRLFIMYKRARLPQPKAGASVCAHCGWVEGDDYFQALLEERINHR
jgi:hypothetical protein